MIVSIDNIKQLLIDGKNPVIKQRIYGNDTINTYKLFKGIEIRLTNKQNIFIPKDYVWDLASVPRFLWSLIPPDSDAEIAFLIHDFLYENHINLGLTKEFCDTEMYRWSKETNGTNKISLRNIDNKLRYLAVKLFGGKVFYSHKN